MIPLHDEDREPLQVWKRSLQAEDEQDDISEQEVIGTAATLTVICGVVIVIVGAVVCGIVWLVNHRHLVGL